MKNLFSLLILLSFGILAKAQVTSVDYQIKYDSSTCLHDCYFIVKGGSALTTFHRIALNSSYSIVSPYGSNVSVVSSYNPTKRIGPPGIPIPWYIGSEISYPIINPNFDFTHIYPTSNSGIGEYDTLYTGDSVRLFSLSIIPTNPNDNPLIRVFNNNFDPHASDPNMNGNDFSNGFTMGGANQLYNSNIESYYPFINQLSSVIDTLSGLSIDITPEASACQLPFTFQWFGPNNYYSITEDVFIDPYTPINRGKYTLIIKDANGFEHTEYFDIGNYDFKYPIPESLELTENINSIGVVLPILGDENLNSKLIIEYKKVGTLNFKKAAPSTRIYPSMIVDGSTINKNHHASSILFLDPFTKYNLRAKLVDYDADTFFIDTVFTTRYVRETNPNQDTFYVIPGNGGGIGTLTNPFLGIQEAVSNISTKGKVILVGDGIYSSFYMSSSGYLDSPTTLKSQNLHGAIIDGNNTLEAIIEIGGINNRILNIIVDGFIIQNGHFGIDAVGTQRITIRNNKLSNVNYGIINSSAKGIELSQHIYNNEIIGRTIWPQANGVVPEERGIDIRGNNNTIFMNSISNFGDGISTEGISTGISKSLEIHHNFINKTVDDLIEIDGTVSNTLVYRNKLMNGRTGVSLSPILGGPAYVFRNEIINTENSALKLNNQTTGIQAYHNTILNSGNGLSSTPGWQSLQFINNSVISKEYIYEEFHKVSNGIYNYKNNAYKSDRTGTAMTPWFRWDSLNYATLNDLQSNTSQDSNSIEVTLVDFSNVTIPSTYNQEILITDNNLYPSQASSLLNNGKLIDMLNDPFVVDFLPDIGALELGQPYPFYGHDFTNTCSYNNLSNLTWNGSKSDSWYDEANWTPCGVPNSKTNVIIPANTPFSPFLNTEIEIKSLNIEFEASFHNYGNIVLAP